MVEGRVIVRSFELAMVMVICSLAGVTRAGSGRSRIQWSHLSSMNNQIPVPDVGRQVATLILDIDSDGVNDFVVASYEKIAWFRRANNGWTRYAVENGAEGVRIEAGGDFYDIDGDGDLDILEGAQSKAGEIWWWENPRPEFQRQKPWKRHQVIAVGGTHHDQIFGDFDGDGKIELAFWYNRGKQLFLAEIPADPTQAWPVTRIAQLRADKQRPEGLTRLDINGDGKLDIIGGGHWFEHIEAATFKAHPIDDDYLFSRSAAGDLIEGGWPEVVIGSGDGVGPLALYEYKDGKWTRRVLIEQVDHGHSLRVGDIDADGHLDVYTGEMYRPGSGDKCRQWVLYGDGKGRFETQLISTGIGCHECRIGDLDGDGDLDILQKDFQQDQRVDVWLNNGTRPGVRGVGTSAGLQGPLALDKFTYIQVDDKRDKRYFGLAFADFTDDGYVDIVAGKWFYRNPGGDLTGTWERFDIDDQIDALAAVDVDGDEFGDVIGLRPNEQYWYEAADKSGSRWNKVRIGSLPIDDHNLSTQIYGLGQLIPGGKPEIILSEYFLEIPSRPREGNWPATKYSSEGSGYAIGDIDGDDLADIAGAYRVPGEGSVPGTRNVTWECSRVCWWKNPGNGAGPWQRFDMGTATHADRFALADLDGDGRLDLAITEERYPGHVPNGSCYWFEQPDDPTGLWSRHLIVTQLSMNNLDAGDVDRDGDIDLVTCEHTMPYQGKPAPGGVKLEIWQNDGRGHFTRRIVDREKESHLGAQLVDLDADGDLDIVSIAWRDFQYLHIWRNDAL